jgi:hypothetical protein
MLKPGEVFFRQAIIYIVWAHRDFLVLYLKQVTQNGMRFFLDNLKWTA